MRHLALAGMCGMLVLATPHHRVCAGNGYSVTVQRTKARQGGEFRYSWSAPPNHPQDDWVGVYRVGDPPEQQLRAQILGPGEFGGFSATVPGGAGTVLELRIYSADRRKLYVRSVPFVVVDSTATIESTPSLAIGANGSYGITVHYTQVKIGSIIQFSTSAPEGHRSDDLVGLYKVGAQASEPLCCLQSLDWPPFKGFSQYVPGPVSGGVTVGSVLELRIYSNDRKTLRVRSCPMVVVADTATISRKPSLCIAIQ